MLTLLALTFVFLLAPPLAAQSQVSVEYTLRVDARDTTAFEVEMRATGAGERFRIAMAKHPEYDDRFWRFVEELRVVAPAGGSVTRADSAVWRVHAPGAQPVTLRWRVRVPFEPRPRASWRPFLAATGALVGGPHSFPYVVGAERARSRVTLVLPPGWRVATALPSDGAATRLRADSVHQLVESPILVGALREWRFDVRGVPHRVAYWPRPEAPAFDTARFVDGIARLAREAATLFGRIPYREYTFLFQDAAYGGLEHPASVTLGAPAERLARDPHADLEETAHEFVHTWNLMHVRPAEYRGVDHRPIAPSRVLWFSEGLTMYYADLLPRRAGVPSGEDSTRIAHLEGIVARYLSNPVHGRVSPESLSVVAYNAGPEALGDYQGGVHLPGEVLGAALDLMIRGATAGRRSADDLMRLMVRRHGGAARGIGTADIEAAVRETCGCDAKPFFDTHVRGAARVDLARHLAAVGLRLRVADDTVRDGAAAAPDWRVWAYTAGNDTTSPLRLRLIDPTAVWGRAGLHTGDVVTAINGVAVRSWPGFRAAVSRLRVGDSVAVTLDAGGTPRVVRFTMQGYTRPVVRIERDPQAPAERRALGEAWLEGRATGP